MIKQIITTTTLIAAAATMANAATAIFDFNTSAITTTSTNTNGITEIDSGASVSFTGTGIKLSDGSAASGTFGVTFANVGGAATAVAGKLDSTVYGTRTNTGAVVNDSTFTNPTTTYAMEKLGTEIAYDAWGDGITIRQRTITVTVSGLSAGTSYSIALFVGAKDRSGSGNTTVSFVDNKGSMVENTNYCFRQNAGSGATVGKDYKSMNITANAQQAGAWYADVIASSAGLIEFQIKSPGGAYQTLNAFAISGAAIPEPSMFGLLAGLGALALVGARRRRK